jgi:hypothetical protein
MNRVATAVQRNLGQLGDIKIRRNRGIAKDLGRLTGCLGSDGFEIHGVGRESGLDAKAMGCANNP